MKAILFTSCGCSKMINVLKVALVIKLPLFQKNPNHLDCSYSRDFEYVETENICNERVLIYKEKTD